MKCTVELGTNGVLAVASGTLRGPGIFEVELTGTEYRHVEKLSDNWHRRPRVRLVVKRVEQPNVINLTEEDFDTEE